MTIKLPLMLLALGAAIGSSACSGANERASSMNPTRSNNAATTNANLSGKTSTAATAAADSHAADADVPAAVRSALAGATTITKQHKDIPASAVFEIERETNTKIRDKDHHSYLGFATDGGARRQIGAATIVNAGGKEMVVMYESRNGLPYIKEVRAEGVPANFLEQFKGKGHDDKLRVGQDVRANGVDDQTAQLAANAIRQDTRIMQALYGGAHSH